MIERPVYFWILLSYIVVFAGIVLFHSAWGALVGFHLSLLPVIVRYRKKIYSSLRVSVSGRLLFGTALTGLIAGAGLWIIWPAMGLSNQFMVSITRLGLSGGVWAPFIAYFTLVNPILEEAYWRIALGNMSKQPARVDLLFAGYHMIILSQFVSIYWMVFSLIILIFASWFWRQTLRFTDSIMPAVCAHLMADFSLLIVIYRFSL